MGGDCRCDRRRGPGLSTTTRQADLRPRGHGDTSGRDWGDEPRSLMRPSVLMKAATTGEAAMKGSAVRRQVWGRLRREEQVGELMHGDDDLGGTVVDCGWRYGRRNDGVGDLSAGECEREGGAIYQARRAAVPPRRWLVTARAGYSSCPVAPQGADRSVDQAAARQDGDDEGVVEVGQERDTLLSDESAKDVSQIRHKQSAPASTYLDLPRLSTAERGYNQQSTKD